MDAEYKIIKYIKKTVLAELRTERAKRKQTIGQLAKALDTNEGVIDVAELYGRVSWKLLRRWMDLYHKRLRVELVDKA